MVSFRAGEMNLRQLRGRVEAWGKHPIAAPSSFRQNVAVVKMVSLGRAVFWWETARFI
jgi:hypothetical protein